MPLTLRPFKLGPAVYAHLADYEVFEEGELAWTPRPFLRASEHSVDGSR
jgi:hypothetical protein